MLCNAEEEDKRGRFAHKNKPRFAEQKLVDKTIIVCCVCVFACQDVLQPTFRMVYLLALYSLGGLAVYMRFTVVRV